MSTRILLIHGHRNPAASRLNRALLDTAKGLPHIRQHNLTERYPNFDIDVAYEQKLLLDHDTIILQFPFYWYSTPAILKEWQDVVLDHGFAYGAGGDKLRGKKLLVATTTGGPVESYQASGYNNYTLDELLKPLQATANLTGMAFQPIFSLSGAMALDEAALEAAKSAYHERLSRL